jgi:hypothetical protein
MDSIDSYSCPNMGTNSPAKSPHKGESYTPVQEVVESSPAISAKPVSSNAVAVANAALIDEPLEDDMSVTRIVKSQTKESAYTPIDEPLVSDQIGEPMEEELVVEPPERQNPSAKKAVARLELHTEVS